MLKPIVRADWRSESARFVAAESLALSILLLVAVYVLRDTDFLRVAPWQPILGVCAGLAAYWTLQALGRDSIAFWLMAPAFTFPHIAPAWSHNRIGWHGLLEFQEGLVAERSVYWDITLFLVCLVLLMTLHRVMGLKRLNRQMLLQGVDPQEKRLVIRYESFAVIGLIVAGLLAAGPTIVAAAVLTRNDGPLGGSPLAAATIGGGAAVLLASTLWLWFGGLQGSRDEEGTLRPDTMKES